MSCTSGAIILPSPTHPDTHLTPPDPNPVSTLVAAHREHCVMCAWRLLDACLLPLSSCDFLDRPPHAQVRAVDGRAAVATQTLRPEPGDMVPEPVRVPRTGELIASSRSHLISCRLQRMLPQMRLVTLLAWMLCSWMNFSQLPQ